LKRIARGKIQIAVPVRKRGASIQASFRGQNLGLEGFLNGLKQFWKVLFQKDDQV
jgi:hypothetical protein